MSGHGGGGGKKKRRGGHGGGGGHGDARFLVTYADLLTVLMALFLVLWVLATIDLNKFKKFTQGLGDFGNPAAEVVKDISEASPGETTPEVTEPDPTAGETTDTVAPSDGAGGGQGGELTSKELEGVADQLTGSLAAAGVPTTASTIRVEARGLIVTIQTDGVLFESGAAQMTQGGRDILAVLAPEFSAIDNKIIIEGHTDKRPLARVGFDNWNLSADRAISVLRTLKDDLGVPGGRLAATGYGEFHPVDPGDTPEAYAKNRRVEIVVVAKNATTPAPAKKPAPAADAAAADGTDGIPAGEDAPTTETSAATKAEPKKAAGSPTSSSEAHAADGH